VTRLVVTIVSCAGWTTSSVRAAVAVSGVGVELSATVNVTGKLPDCVGAPEIAPVAVLRLSPVGRAPAVMDQVSGAMPPTVSMRAPYAAPITALGMLVVAIDNSGGGSTTSFSLRMSC
jgi:hypothetical protein